MYLIDYSTCQLADLLERFAIAQHKAFHDVPRERRRGNKRPLPVLKEIGINSLRHVFWSQKARVIWID